jgi:hypothetical protein
MTVRTIDLRRQAPVPRCWQRGRNALHDPAVRMPEPAQLYSLAVLYLHLHAPHPASSRCESCAQSWPCEPVSLAYRLREGF